MQFIFIYGKNPEISLAELLTYFKSRSPDFRIIENTKNFLVADVSKIPGKIIEDLGGTIKIAEVLLSSEIKPRKEIQKNLEQKDFSEIFSKLPHKIVFGISCYSSERNVKSYYKCREYQKFFSEFFKNLLAKEGIKSHYIKTPKGRTALSHVEIIKRQILEKYFEFLVCYGKKFYLARTIGVHNPFEFQKRDIERPVQRTMFSIPPRLCRIMINLSGIRKGLLLDPFCGIGSILQEATLMGFDVRGIDNDPHCVKGCVENLRWLEKEYNIKIEDIEKKIRVGDARNLSKYFSENSIDVVVTEPFLGPPLKRKPNEKEAREIIRNLIPLYKVSLSEMLKVLKKEGVIVIVSPAFRTKGGLTRLPLDEIVKGLGAKIANPIKGHMMDFEERHKTLREITVIKRA